MDAPVVEAQEIPAQPAVPAETPIAAPAPAEEIIAAPVVMEETPAEAQEAAAAAELPAFSPEDMELLSTPAPKKRTHRGGRRRGGKQSTNQAK